MLEKQPRKSLYFGASTRNLGKHIKTDSKIILKSYPSVHIFSKFQLYCSHVIYLIYL